MKIEIGHEIITDGRLERGGIFQKLEACDYWDAAEFILRDEREHYPDQAVNVKVTGRGVRYDAPKLGGVPVIRIQVTFPGDGEPDQIVGGWARA